MSSTAACLAVEFSVSKSMWYFDIDESLNVGTSTNSDQTSRQLRIFRGGLCNDREDEMDERTH